MAEKRLQNRTVENETSNRTLPFHSHTTLLLLLPGSLFNTNWVFTTPPLEAGSDSVFAVIDGDPSSYFTIERIQDPFFLVHLFSTVNNIQAVQVVKGPNTDRFQDVQVWVGTNGFNVNNQADFYDNAERCGVYEPNNSDQTVWISCETPVSGRTLLLLRDEDNSQLEIAELYVYIA